MLFKSIVSILHFKRVVALLFKRKVSVLFMNIVTINWFFPLQLQYAAISQGNSKYGAVSNVTVQHILLTVPHTDYNSLFGGISG